MKFNVFKKGNGKDSGAEWKIHCFCKLILQFVKYCLKTWIHFVMNSKLLYFINVYFQTRNCFGTALTLAGAIDSFAVLSLLKKVWIFKHHAETWGKLSLFFGLFPNSHKNLWFTPSGAPPLKYLIKKCDFITTNDYLAVILKYKKKSEN